MAVRVNQVINQGETFSTVINLTDANGNDYNVTGYTAVGAMRKHYGSTNSTSFNITLANGSCTMAMNAVTTAALSDGRWVYDVDLIAANHEVTRIVEGIITVKPAAAYWSNTQVGTNWPTYTPGVDLPQSNVANNSF